MKHENSFPIAQIRIIRLNSYLNPTNLIIFKISIIECMPALLEQLNKVYFWDTDFNKLEEYQSKRLIIERIMNYGNLHEIQLIKAFYGVEEIISTLCNLNYIDPKTLNFISLMFHIPKTKFKCYIRKQLTNQPWSY